MKVLLVESWPAERRPFFDPDEPLLRMLNGHPHEMKLDVESFVSTRLEATRIARERLDAIDVERRRRLAGYVKNWDKTSTRGVVRAFGKGETR